MLVIDTHCHAGISWMEPVESLLYQMDLNGVAKALLVQHGGSYDNGYLLESVQRFPGRFGVVLGLDPLDPEAPLTLERLAERPGVVGLRLAPESPPALWRKAGQMGLPVSCVLSEATEAANPSFQHMVKDLPGGTIVLEHLAGAYVPRSVVSVTEPYTAYLTALSLAQYPNIYIKFGGLGEICPRPPRLRPQFGFDVVPPVLEMALEAFGPQRMLWGSDYPPVGAREGYHNALDGAMQHRAFASVETREWAFGKTAASVWKLG